MYLGFINKVNTMTSTIYEARIEIYYFVLGTTPIFISFSLLFWTLFWRSSPHFTDATSSIITCFAVANGDVVIDVINGVWNYG